MLSQKDELDAKVKTLTETSHKLAEAMYKKEQGGCESGSCGTDTKRKKMMISSMRMLNNISLIEVFKVKRLGSNV